MKKLKLFTTPHFFVLLLSLKLKTQTNKSFQMKSNLNVAIVKTIATSFHKNIVNGPNLNEKSKFNEQ